MATVRDIYNHNRKEAAKFKDYFKLMPKVIALYAADAIMAGVTRPASRNYMSSMSGAAGKLMPHSSSNAAWNWRVSFGSEAAPLDAKDKEYNPNPIASPSTRLIGHAYEQRSTFNYATAQLVSDERRRLDINGKLYRKLFSASAKSMPPISIYNNIDKLGWSDYVRHSNVKNAAAEGVSYAVTGEIIAKELILNFMSTGTNGTPNTSGLLKAVKAGRSTNFVKWV